MIPASVPLAPWHRAEYVDDHATGECRPSLEVVVVRTRSGRTFRVPFCCGVQLEHLKSEVAGAGWFVVGVVDRD